MSVSFLYIIIGLLAIYILNVERKLDTLTNAALALESEVSDRLVLLGTTISSVCECYDGAFSKLGIQLQEQFLATHEIMIEHHTALASVGLIQEPHLTAVEEVAEGKLLQFPARKEPAE
ncbi:hypothetical protein DM806_20200 [Sphingobium lactosutens]|uniref:hypothetical protein n=1 Tax=Sphingobium lactosutens TaxID=522773 RepID=UPI0015C172EF|nr:hypothetical protein [Sphingobium lactosutens]NWK97938.1 hypothetical protein [Sphingobium lactosutens]